MLAAVINKNKDELIDNQIWRTINNVTKTQSERNLMLTVWVTKVTAIWRFSSATANRGNTKYFRQF